MGLTAWEVPCLIRNLSISWFGNRKIPGPEAYLCPALVNEWFYPGSLAHPRATPGSRDQSLGTLP